MKIEIKDLITKEDQEKYNTSWWTNDLLKTLQKLENEEKENFLWKLYIKGLKRMKDKGGTINWEKVYYEYKDMKEIISELLEEENFLNFNEKEKVIQKGEIKFYVRKEWDDDGVPWEREYVIRKINGEVIVKYWLDDTYDWYPALSKSLAVTLNQTYFPELVAYIGEIFLKKGYEIFSSEERNIWCEEFGSKITTKKVKRELNYYWLHIEEEAEEGNVDIVKKIEGMINQKRNNTEGYPLLCNNKGDMDWWKYFDLDILVIDEKQQWEDDPKITVYKTLIVAWDSRKKAFLGLSLATNTNTEKDLGVPPLVLERLILKEDFNTPIRDREEYELQKFFEKNCETLNKNKVEEILKERLEQYQQRIVVF